jgi:hypothetical protein
MTSISKRRSEYRTLQAMDAENRKLRFELQQAKEQIFEERKRADLLQVDLDMALGAIRELRDWEQKTARMRANGEYR